MSLQVMMPSPALQPAGFPQSFDVGGQSQADDGVAADASSSDASSGGTELPPEVDKLLQQLMQLLTDSGAGSGVVQNWVPLS